MEKWLSDAEGLADLIDATQPSPSSLRQIDGALRAPVMAWRAELIELAARRSLIDLR